MAILVDAGETEVILDGVRYLRIEGACDCGPLSCYIFERGYLPTKHLQNRYQRPLRER